MIITMQCMCIKSPLKQKHMSVSYVTIAMKPLFLFIIVCNKNQNVDNAEQIFLLLPHNHILHIFRFTINKYNKYLVHKLLPLEINLHYIHTIIEFPRVHNLIYTKPRYYIKTLSRLHAPIHIEHNTRRQGKSGWWT